MDVDEKGRAYIIVPAVWLGKLCAKTTVFILMYRHSMTQVGAEILWEKKTGGGSMCLFLDIVQKKKVPACMTHPCMQPSDLSRGKAVSKGNLETNRLRGSS